MFHTTKYKCEAIYTCVSCTVCDAMTLDRNIRTDMSSYLYPNGPYAPAQSGQHRIFEYSHVSAETTPRYSNRRRTASATPWDKLGKDQIKLANHRLEGERLFRRFDRFDTRHTAALRPTRELFQRKHTTAHQRPRLLEGGLERPSSSQHPVIVVVTPFFELTTKP